MSRAFLLSSSLALAMLAVPADSQAAPVTATETKDRLPPETMAVLVADPLRAAEKGDLRKAERAFDRLVGSARGRHGAAGVREADLTTAFGVQLYVRGSELEREDMRRLSLGYMWRAVEASRRAFGPRHPETALALHSYADVLVELAGEVVPEAAEAALAESYSIRQATLGADNAETLAAMRALARAKAARSRTTGRLDEAAELFRGAIAIAARTSPSEDYLRPASLRLALVRAYVEAGRMDDALREARLAAAEASLEREKATDGPCGFAAAEAHSIVAALEAGRPAEAAALREALVPPRTCLEEIFERLSKDPG